MTTEFSPAAAMRGKLSTALGRKRMVVMLTRRDVSDLEVLRNLLGSYAITPVIDMIYPSEALRDAITSVGSGPARGKVAVSVRES